MSSRIKAFVQYTIILSITILLVWFSLRGLTNVDGGDPSVNSWDYLRNAWYEADKGWLIAMAIVAFISHFIRAIRWKMLMEPAGHISKLSNSFFSLMVGYLVNIVVPRGGEVSRCYNLYKLEKTPVEISFGTVVTERIIDVLCLLILIGFSFLMESTKLIAFINTLPLNFEGGTSKAGIILIVLAVVILLAAIGFFVLRSNAKLQGFIKKTFLGFKDGLLSIFKLRNPTLFIFYSVVIWALYFVMSYTVLKAFPSTESLGFNAVLSLFAIGSIAMAAPLPGGTGSYHVLVPQGLVFLYAIPKADAIAFTFIFHGWQTMIVIVGGAISLLITSILVKKNER